MYCIPPPPPRPLPSCNDLTLSAAAGRLPAFWQFYGPERSPSGRLLNSRTPPCWNKAGRCGPPSVADCHGASGEGVEGGFEKPLIGDASIGELADLISRTMPEGDSQQCVGEDASAVAAYVHQAFYSEAARLRNRPPRVMLARLTANQLRQSISDLYGWLDGFPDPDEQRGLKAMYFDGPQWKKEKLKAERVDNAIDFDFGKESPVDGVSPKEFYIQWEGGLKVDATGEYEIVLRTTCSCMMYFGRSNRVLVDNHVQSGDKTEFRERLRLTAGRVYPLKIEMRQRKRKTEQPPARITLAWAPPGGVERVIPQRNLTPGWAPPTFALSAELPPDDRSYGFERGIRVDRQWDDSTTTAALEFGAIAAQEMWPQYRRKNKKIPDEDRQRLRAFLSELVARAFRGELTEEQRRLYIDQQLAAEPNDTEAIKRVLLAAMKSPRFLYPLLDADRSQSRRVANRLALTLWDSLPTERWLLAQIERDQLDKESVRRNTAKRMARDYRAQAKALEFLWSWLNLQERQELAKSPELSEEWSPELASDLRDSLERFLTETVADPQADYRRLILAKRIPVTPAISAFYGEEFQPESEDPFGLSKPSDRRFGVLTHPYVAARLSYRDSTSPIHRGVFLIRHVLGRTLRPPAEAFTPLSPDLHPDLTTRERVALQTGAEGCQVCHRRINGLGFALESYDTLGRFRETERGKPIDCRGEYVDRSGKHIVFDETSRLADYLAENREAHAAFVRRAFQHFVKQPPAAFGANTLDNLTDRFRENNLNIRQLLIEIAVTASDPNRARESTHKELP